MRSTEAIRISPPLTANGLGGESSPSERAGCAMSKILTPADIRLDVPVERKREAFEVLAAMLAERTGTTPGAVLAALLRRERLGSTYIGNRIAMPHGRLTGAERPAAAILRLGQPVDYATGDGDMADLLVALVWPDTGSFDFVPTLARLWRRLRTPSVREALREAQSPEALHSVIALANGGRIQ